VLVQRQKRSSNAKSTSSGDATHALSLRFEPTVPTSSTDSSITQVNKTHSTNSQVNEDQAMVDILPSSSMPKPSNNPQEPSPANLGSAELEVNSTDNPSPHVNEDRSMADPGPNHSVPPNLLGPNNSDFVDHGQRSLPAIGEVVLSTTLPLTVQAQRRTNWKILRDKQKRANTKKRIQLTKLSFVGV